MKIFITGSNFYDHSLLKWEKVQTQYGTVEWLRGKVCEKSEEIIILPRHGENHKNLPNSINYLANFEAIKKENPECVISFSVCGILDRDLPLAIPILPNNFFFPENRLPSGEICTIFQGKNSDEKKGHLIPISNYFHSKIQSDIHTICKKNKCLIEKNYIHANGPRFNSPLEIKYFQTIGGDILSQTCGPEIVMTNELEIPFGMVCVGIDYANGVSEIPTSIETLNSNLEMSKDIFMKIIENISMNNSLSRNKKYEFENFLYTL